MILVGVDGSEVARRAFAWAVSEARLRGVPVTVAHAFQHPHSAATTDGGAIVHPWMEKAEAFAREQAERVTTDVVGNVGDVPIDRVVAEGERPGDLLVRLSRDAELLVVGSRGRGSVAGMLLGSVSQQCVHGAHCPVVVIPRADRA